MAAIEAAVFSLMDHLTEVLAPLRPYAESITLFSMPSVQAELTALAAPNGPVPATIDVLKYLIAILASYPLSAVFAAIPNSMPAAKHLFSLVFGVVLAQFVFGYEWVHALVTSAVVYLVVAGTSRIRAFDSWRHLIVFAFMLLYLFTMHLFRVYHDYMGWTLDITGPLMLLTIKVRCVSAEN
jgi:lysophospholipid acyltransferase